MTGPSIFGLFRLIKICIIPLILFHNCFSSNEVRAHHENADPRQQLSETFNTCPADSTIVKPLSQGITKAGAEAKNEQIKIFGGKKAKEGQFPYQVYLKIGWAEVGYDFMICGGSIIHEEFILTAAHCLTEAKFPLDINVTAGETRPETYPTKGQRRRGIQIFIHEEFDQAVFLENDIALIKLDKAFSFTKLVKPILLPSPSNVPEGIANASGWGRLHSGQDYPPADVLMYVDDLNVIEDETCQLLNHEYIIKESMICAYNPKHDTCQGDSGGPLVCSDEEGSPYLCGVISFGHGCAIHGRPGIYTEVSHFISWIEKFVPLQILGQKSGLKI